MKHLTQLITALAALSASASVMADLVVDQTQNNPYGLLVGGGISGPAMQAFTPTYNNVAGVDLMLSGTGALVASASVQLERVVFRGDSVLVQNADKSLTTEHYGYVAEVTVLARSELSGLPRSDYATALAQFRWNPVAVTPGETYYLRFNSTGLGLGTFGGSEGYLPSNALSVETLHSSLNGGLVSYGTVADGGFYTAVTQKTYDIAFKTYASTSAVPESDAVNLALAGGAILAAWRMKQRRRLS